MAELIRVLIVDDSAVVRQALTETLTSGLSIEVIANVSDPLIAADKISRQRPDVITLDVGGCRGRKVVFNAGDGSVLLCRQKTLCLGPEK